MTETTGAPIVTYTNYFQSGCHPTDCKDVVVQSIDQKTIAHLDRQVRRIKQSRVE